METLGAVGVKLIEAGFGSAVVIGLFSVIFVVIQVWFSQQLLTRFSTKLDELINSVKVLASGQNICSEHVAKALTDLMQAQDAHTEKIITEIEKSERAIVRSITREK